MSQCQETTGAGASHIGRPAEVKVWDPFVRIFHWSLVALFFLAFLTGDDAELVHIWAGYAVAGLVALRIVWGFIGPRHARFSDFVRGPATVIAYLRDSLLFRARRYIGHNPAGGVMVLALFALIAAVTATGYMLTTEALHGVRWIKHLHEAVVNLTLLIVGVHVAGVIFTSIEHGENLVRAMVTGRKRAE
jgi:cytochrome b